MIFKTQKTYPQTELIICIKRGLTTSQLSNGRIFTFVVSLRCEVPEHLAPHIRVTSWLHEEGTAIEIFPERDPRGKYTLLQSGDLLVHHTSTYDTYKKYVCKTEHELSGLRRRSLVPARLALKGTTYLTIYSSVLLLLLTKNIDFIHWLDKIIFLTS